MPDPFERHGKSSEDGWGGAPSRSQQRAAAASDDPVQPEHKGRRRRSPDYCNASPDKQHHGEIILNVTPSWTGAVRKCQWRPCWFRRENRTGDAQMVWGDCIHQEICTGCSRDLHKGEGLGLRCPDHPGSPEQKQEAIAKFLEQESRPRRYRRRRPVISGPQGYRKPKKGKGNAE